MTARTDRKQELKIKNLNKVFEIGSQTLKVLKDINLEVEDGEFISIVGSSGCGKSTLLKMIIGLEEIADGDIVIGDRKVAKPSVECGMVFQEARLYPWLSVEKNIEFGIAKKMSPKEKRRTVKEHIDLVGLTGFEKALPKQLSGGMQQRVSIARALVNNPGLLLLDEPFGALDALTKINMQNEVLKIWEAEKKIMILVTHDVDEAISLSDRIVVMSQRPGTIEEIIPVPMSRPRDRSSYEFIEVRRKIYKHFFHNSDIDVEYYL